MDIEDLSSNQCAQCGLATEVPEIPTYGPTTRRDLEPGKTYFWCSCGRSKNQPFCDGSHQGTRFRPVAFQAKANSINLLCNCKYTSKPPFCNGFHGTMDFEQTEPPCKCPHDASGEMEKSKDCPRRCL